MLAIGGAALCTAFAAATFLLVLHQQADVLREEGRHLRNVAASASDHTSRSLRALDEAMGRTSQWLAPHGAVAPDEAHAAMVVPGTRPKLPDLSAALPPSQAILLFDAAGNLVDHSYPNVTETPVVNVADRAYFKKIRDSDASKVLVTEPVVGRSTGMPTFFLARKLPGEHGAFAGFVPGAVKVEYLQTLFGTTHLLPRGTVNLFHTDSILLARTPAEPSRIGQQFPLELVRRIGAADGTHIHRNSLVDDADRLIAPSDCLIKNADLALHKAKSHGRGRYCFFDPAFEQGLRERR
jgi:hypothetical protein